jgi:hypothetical protein
MRFLLVTSLILLSGLLFSQIEYKHERNESFTYEEAIQNARRLADKSPFIKLLEYGKTDVGRPLHLLVFDHKRWFEPYNVKDKDQTVFMINNAIHPGESCGVDATIKLFEHLSNHAGDFKNIVVVAIPVYNIGGMLNRSPYNRSGQPGPVECGFRGNYQNLDLNRDFIKCDSKNAVEFERIYHLWKPKVFIETHTTNGSDHQYTLTLITSQRDKMNPKLAEFAYGEMEPYLYKRMKEKDMEMIPYVYSYTGKYEEGAIKGIRDFLETPRYSSGYVNLFNTIGFISEAHKYKSFEDRVEQTHHLLLVMTKYLNANFEMVNAAKQQADMLSAQQKEFPLYWTLDTTEFETIPFKGFESGMKTSEVTGQPRVFYDTTKPIEYDIRYFRNYVTSEKVNRPTYYVLPQCYPKIAELLKVNGVIMQQLVIDSTISGEMYYLDLVENLQSPYEKHFLHNRIKVHSERLSVKFYRGDYLIPLDQPHARYIIETLEPVSADSWFRWNFFDNILQQKEWFSEFAFDDIASDLLEQDEELRKLFEYERTSDPEFASDHFRQLYWIFKRSPYYEKTHNRYPVMRIMQ